MDCIVGEKERPSILLSLCVLLSLILCHSLLSSDLSSFFVFSLSNFHTSISLSLAPFLLFLSLRHTTTCCTDGFSWQYSSESCFPVHLSLFLSHRLSLALAHAFLCTYIYHSLSLSHSLTTLTFPLSVSLSLCHTRTHTYIHTRLHFINLSVELGLPCAVLIHYHPFPIASFIAVFETVIIFLKLVSYVQVNGVCRCRNGVYVYVYVLFFLWKCMFAVARSTRIASCKS